MGVPLLGKLRTVFQFVRAMKRRKRNVGLIGENLFEYELWTGDHESQGCSKKDTSILYRTINLFYSTRRACRNSTCRFLHLELFVILKTPYIFGMFR